VQCADEVVVVRKREPMKVGNDEEAGHQREWQEDGCGEMEEFQHAHHSSNHAEPVL